MYAAVTAARISERTLCIPSRGCGSIDAAVLFNSFHPKLFPSPPECPVEYPLALAGRTRGIRLEADVFAVNPSKLGAARRVALSKRLELPRDAMFLESSTRHSGQGEGPLGNAARRGN
jgi:hypothetical protein